MSSEARAAGRGAPCAPRLISSSVSTGRCAPVDAMTMSAAVERAAQVAPVGDVGAEALRQLVGARARPVGDRQRRAVRAQRARRQLRHLARADDQHAPPREVADDLARELHRDGADRHRVAGDRVSRRTRRATRNAPSSKQVRSTAPAVPCWTAASYACLVWPEDLRLAHDQRIEAGGDAEQVADGRRVAVLVEVLGQIRPPATPARRASTLGQPGARRGRRRRRRRTARRGCRSTASPPRGRRAARSARRAPPSTASGSTASRSRTATGAVRCETPTSSRSMVAPRHVLGRVPDEVGRHAPAPSPPKPPSVSQAARRPRQPAPTRATSKHANATQVADGDQVLGAQRRPGRAAARAARPRSRRSRSPA